jgi:hypothetical protein
MRSKPNYFGKCKENLFIIEISIIKVFKTQKHLSKICFLVLLFSILSFLFLTYTKYKDDKYVTWDGYVYLVYSYSVLSGNKLFLDHIRSPLLSLVIPPDLEIARIVNCIYLLLLSIVVFAIIEKLTNNPLLALFGGILVGTNSYLLFFTKYTLSDLPAILFFCIGLLFYFENKKITEFLSGIFFGFSFIFRPDIGVLLLPPFIFKIRNITFLKFCLTSFLFLSVLVNFLVSSFIFSKWIYPPLHFLLVNFVTEKMAFNTQTTAYTDYFWFLRNFAFFNILLLPFLVFSVRWLGKDKNYNIVFIVFTFLTLVHSILPKIDARIYVTKSTPLAAILSSFAFRNNKKMKSTFIFLIFIILTTIVFLHFFFIWERNPSIWRVDKIEFKKEGNICSNVPFAYIYFTKREPCHLISYFNIPVERRNISWLTENIRLMKCDYVYVFTYPDISLTWEETMFILHRFNTTILDTVGMYPVYELKIK